MGQPEKVALLVLALTLCACVLVVHGAAPAPSTQAQMPSVFFKGLIDAVRGGDPALKSWPPASHKAKQNMASLNAVLGRTPNADTERRPSRPSHALAVLAQKANAALSMQYSALSFIEELIRHFLGHGAAYKHREFKVYREEPEWSFKYHLEVASWHAGHEKCRESYAAELYNARHGTELDDRMATIHQSREPWIMGDFKIGRDDVRFCPYLSYDEGAAIKYDDCEKLHPFICELFLPADYDKDEDEDWDERPRPPRPDHERPRPPRPDHEHPRPPRPDHEHPRPPRPDHEHPRPPRPTTENPRPTRPDHEHPRPPRPDHEHPRPPRPDHEHPRPPRPDHEHPRPPRPDHEHPRPPRPDHEHPRPPRPDHEHPRPPRPTRPSGSEHPWSGDGDDYWERPHHHTRPPWPQTRPTRPPWYPRPPTTTPTITSTTPPTITSTTTPTITSTTEEPEHEHHGHEHHGHEHHGHEHHGHEHHGHEHNEHEHHEHEHHEHKDGETYHVQEHVYHNGYYYQIDVEVTLIEALRNNMETLIDAVKETDDDQLRISSELTVEPLAAMREVIALAARDTIAARLHRLTMLQRASLAVNVNEYSKKVQKMTADRELLAKKLARGSDGKQPLVVELNELLEQMELLH